MSDIQKAREVLAKWRKPAPGMTRQPWFVSFVDQNGWADIAVQDGGVIDGGAGEDGTGEGGVHADIAPLIVGTAGNPDLLDAIDKVLADADRTRPTTEWGDHGLRIAAERIATAIIAADERMSA